MLTRDAVLLYQNTETDTKVQPIDLNLADYISALEFEVECTNGATSNEDNFISDIVTKVEVVDGSDVLASLNLSQLEALHFYHTGKMPAIFPSEWASGLQRHNATLFFGRWLWDRLYALNPTKFKNPQVKVTFNKAVIRAASATGFATGDNIKLTVVAKVMKDVPNVPAFLMQKQVYSFTSAASGEERIELPTDFVYRSLLLRAWLEGSDVNELLSDVKLSADSDAYIFLNRKLQQIDADALARFGKGSIKHDILRANGGIARLIFNKEPQAQLQLNTANLYDIICQRYAWSSTIQVDLATHAGAADATARQITVLEEGHAPHAAVPIFFGDPQRPEDWLNPKNYQRLDLILTNLAASGVIEVVAEQVRPQ